MAPAHFGRFPMFGESADSRGPLDEPSDCLQETRVLLPAPTNKRPPTSALEAQVVMPSSYKSLATAVESA